MTYSSIRVLGGLLPDDIRLTVVAGTAEGMSSNDYHLGGERPREAAARTWAYLQGVYRRFRDDLAQLPEGDAAVGVTRERWLTQLLSALDYGRVPPTGPGGFAVDDRSYPVSHRWGTTPMHLLGWAYRSIAARPASPAPRSAHRMPCCRNC